MKKYKLCRVEVETKSSVIPLGDDGKTITVAPMLEFENDTKYYYAIYEDVGDEEWVEYAYYDDDFAKAVEEYNKLKGEE